MVSPEELLSAAESSGGQYDTRLSPDEEGAFQQWKQRYAPRDSGADYDLRGAYRAGLQPNPQTGHWPDTFKKPNHPTFSDESMYARGRPDLAGHWNGETYIPAAGRGRVSADDLLSAADTPTEKLGLLQSAGEAIGDVLKPVAQAGMRTMRSAGIPTYLPGHQDVGLGQAATDAATIAQPFLLPRATIAQGAAQTALRVGGQSREGAQRGGQIASALENLAEMGASGLRGVQAWRNRKAIQAGLPAGGQEIARAGATAEHQVAPGTAAEAAGQVLKEKIPGAAAEEARNVTTALYDPIAKYAETHGRALRPGSPEAKELHAAILGAQDKWGDRMPSEVGVLLKKLAGSTENVPASSYIGPTGGLVSRPATTRAALEPILYSELDDAYRALRKAKVPGVSSVRAAVDRSMDAALEGTPAGAARTAAGQLWKLYPAKSADLARRVQRAESPGTAIRLLINAPSGQYRHQIAARLLGGAAEDWQKVLTGLDRLAQAKTIGPALKVSPEGATAPSGMVSSLARYAQHRAVYHGIGAVAGGAIGEHHGHPMTDALIGLIAGGALPYAGTAAHFLASGASGRPAAAALARTISAWGRSHPESQESANAVASALHGQE